MNLGDLRRLAVTAIVLSSAALAFLTWLAIHQGGLVDSEGAANALRWAPLEVWLWLGFATVFTVLLLLAALLAFLNDAPRGFARGIRRQVQCQRCKAVFDIHDTGHRPITHICPNCKALGVYDGTAPPVGKPPVPEPAKKVISLGLACDQCDHAFDITDTGARPLRVTCPKCKAKGQVL